MVEFSPKPVSSLSERLVRFTPSWFSVTMGTGIVNTLLFNVPYPSVHPALRAVGSAFLLFDIVLFLAFSSILVARYSLHPAFIRLTLENESHSLFLGTIPMGLVTIMSGIARTGNEYGLRWTLDLGLVGWWVAGVLSVLTAFGVPYIMFTRHTHTASTLTAAFLLPIVPPITIAAVGSSLATLLIADNRADYAFIVLLVSYWMLGIGLGLALGVLIIYGQRLALQRQPSHEVIVSTFLPLGPCGQGGFALIELGRVSLALFPLLAKIYPERPNVQILESIGIVFYGSGVLAGLGLWALGVWWAVIAVASVGALGRSARFNMGWWAFTFPIGSLNLLTYSLGQTFDSPFFNIVGTILTALVTLLWVVVFIPTCTGFVKGTLFAAPCLASLPEGYFKKFEVTEADEEDGKRKGAEGVEKKAEGKEVEKEAEIKEGGGKEIVVG